MFLLVLLDKPAKPAETHLTRRRRRIWENWQALVGRKYSFFSVKWYGKIPVFFYGMSLSIVEIIGDVFVLWHTHCGMASGTFRRVLRGQGQALEVVKLDEDSLANMPGGSLVYTVCLKRGYDRHANK